MQWSTGRAPGTCNIHNIHVYMYMQIPAGVTVHFPPALFPTLAKIARRYMYRSGKVDRVLATLMHAILKLNVTSSHRSGHT